MEPKIRFEESQILEIASRYEFSDEEAEIIGLRPSIDQKGYLSKSELLKVGRWKSLRNAARIDRNADDYVHEITQIALSARNERTRIEILTLLDGVAWPTASVILHFFHEDGYPILDFRAWWSLSIESSGDYNFSKWWRYVVFCRDVAKRNSVDMRTLDRALWQYSKENQEADSS